MQGTRRGSEPWVPAPRSLWAPCAATGLTFVIADNKGFERCVVQLSSGWKWGKLCTPHSIPLVPGPCCCGPSPAGSSRGQTEPLQLSLGCPGPSSS